MPDNTSTTPTAAVALNQTQLADLAVLLRRELATGNIEAVAERVVGREALKAAANDRSDPDGYARRVVQIIREARGLSELLTILRKEAHPKSRLLFDLDRVVQDHALDDTSYQAFRNEAEPFFRSASFEQFFPRLVRATCLVALEVPEGQIQGTGFLVGPDLVMTNYHVIQRFTKTKPDGTIVADESGKKLYCFFDYHALPAPRLPLLSDARYAGVAVRAADDWLEHARPLLKNDGLDDAPSEVDNELDYAIIRLERPIGALPDRKSGGEARGWVTLCDIRRLAINDAPRLVLFQHPGMEPQLWDVGTFNRIDPTQTRIWYGVNTAKGSSGGAAVDQEGKLVALHNAEVQREGIKPPVNQGVRIDRIVDDLRGIKPQCIVNAPTAAPEDSPLDFWSLTDNPRDPRPVIGREAFRSYVANMTKPGGARVLVVSGPIGSGRKFSVDLLRRIVGTAIPIAVFRPSALQKLSAGDFVRGIVEQLDLPGPTGVPMPEAQPTEDIPRWLRSDLAPWLSQTLVEAQRSDGTRFPAWVVMDTTLPADEPLLWAKHLRDCVGALTGVARAGQPLIDIPQLRWLFLGFAPDGLPIGGVARHDEDLEKETDYATDFAKCFQRAWRALDKQSPPVPQALLRAFGAAAIANANTTSMRGSLASYARSVIMQAG